MAYGEHEGRGVRHPEVRAMFTRESLLASDWYHQRLEAKQRHDIQLQRRHIAYLEAFLRDPARSHAAARLGIDRRLSAARQALDAASSPQYLADLVGMLGLDPALAH